MKRILVIEDDEPIQTNLVDLLTLEGYEVFPADNGHQGLERALALLPDLIVCDVRMGGLDGFGFILALDANPTLANIPVILVSAAADRKSIQTGTDLGAVYITKPFTIKNLLLIVAEVLA